MQSGKGLDEVSRQAALAVAVFMHEFLASETQGTRPLRVRRPLTNI